MEQVLDFFFENRVSPEKFPLELGEAVRHMALGDAPGAFAGYYPTGPAQAGSRIFVGSRTRYAKIRP